MPVKAETAESAQTGGGKMLKADVFNWSGEKVSQIKLPAEVFGERLNKPLLNEAVKSHLARKRRGTHKAKTRGEVSGGGRKPFRQKGTGNARQGSIRSPLLEGGGAAHGPRPRDYGWSLPKKVRQKAFRSALSWLFAENRVVFLESMISPEGKTKELSARLKRQGWAKAILADSSKEENFQRACQNLKPFKFVSADSVNIYDMLKFSQLALTPAALGPLYKKCGYERAAAAAESDAGPGRVSNANLKAAPAAGKASNPDDSNDKSAADSDKTPDAKPDKERNEQLEAGEEAKAAPEAESKAAPEAEAKAAESAAEPDGADSKSAAGETDKPEGGS